jgi:hypothetical protein
LIGIRHLREGNLSISSAIMEEIKFHTISGEAISYVMKGLFRLVIILFPILYMGALFLFEAQQQYIRHQQEQRIIQRIQQTLKEPAAASGQPSPGATLVQPTPEPPLEEPSSILPVDVRNTLLSFGAGMMGAVVSLLIRISEFERVSVRSRRYLLYTGATSPIVGGISAGVIAALIQSKLISFPIEQTNNLWGFIVFGFLGGFSERFSGNLRRIAEGRIVSADGKAKPKRSSGSAKGQR